MPGFEENLKTLPSVDHIQRINLLDDTGTLVDSIENRPGKTGSLKIYAAVAARNNGVLDRNAATQALELFAEHVPAARDKPGTHPNIDRLFRIIDGNTNYRIQSVERTSAR